MAWITALRAPAIKQLAQDGGPLQLGLFDQQDLAEITSPDYPGERLVACRNPLLATERARKRGDLLAATEALLAKVKQQVDAGRLKDPDKIGVKADRALRKHKVGKHLVVQVAQGSLELAPRPGQDRRRSCPGRHLRHPHLRPGGNPGRARRGGRLQEPGVGRTRLPPHQGRRPGPAAHLAPAGRPGPRPRAAVHAGLLPGLAPARRLGAADLHRRAPPARADPVAPARRSAAAQAKAARKANSANGQPVRGFRDLLDHLATLTRDTITISGRTVDKLTTPTPTQRRAFDLLNTPIPIALT